MTTVTRHIFVRRAFNTWRMELPTDKTDYAKNVMYPRYRVEYNAEPMPFDMIEAHVQMGGIALALTRYIAAGSFAALFMEQQTLDFQELYLDCKLHVVVHLTEALEDEV